MVYILSGRESAATKEHYCTNTEKDKMPTNKLVQTTSNILLERLDWNEEFGSWLSRMNALLEMLKSAMQAPHLIP